MASAGTEYSSDASQVQENSDQYPTTAQNISNASKVSPTFLNEKEDPEPEARDSVFLRLPLDIVRTLFTYLSPCTSACLGITCAALYEIHFQLHGPTPLWALTLDIGRGINNEWLIIPLKALLHDWMAPRYLWDSDYSTFRPTETVGSRMGFVDQLLYRGQLLDSLKNSNLDEDQSFMLLEWPVFLEAIITGTSFCKEKTRQCPLLSAPLLFRQDCPPPLPPPSTIPTVPIPVGFFHGSRFVQPANPWRSSYVLALNNPDLDVVDKMETDGLTSSSSSRDPVDPLIPLPPQPHSSATTAESHFPQPGLTRTRTHSKSPERSSDDLWAPDAAAALAAVHPLDADMDGAGHRRRRSSLMNELDTSAQTKKRTRSPKSPTKAGRGSIQEEPKLGDRERLIAENHPSDDERSTSEDVELDDMSEEEGLQDDEETGLTGKDKKRRKRRRRRNTLIDQRVVTDTVITPEEKKEADQNVVKSSLINGLLIGLWYLFSLSISIYNKWMFDPDHLDFHFPLFTTCMHMLVQFSLASLVLFLLPRFRPRYDSISNPHNTHTDDELLQHEEESKKPLMTKMFYFTRIGPCGVATGLDIGLGNMSLKFITLTFYTMCKSSALAFVLLFAFLFRLEVPSWRLVAIIATMTLGVIMMVAGEVKFSTLGFILVISAAFFSGFRWGLTQILLLRNPATSNPFSSIFYLAPIMFVSLLIIAIPVEGFPALWKGLEVLIEKKGPILAPLILLFPGAIAFCMTSAEFALLQRTSVVTLSIAGIFKEVVTISAAGLVFHDKLTPINISGLFVTIGAIAAYNYIKITKMRAEARLAAHKLRHGDEDGSPSDADSEGDVVESDWARDGATYVTSDGDILPAPSGFRVTSEAEGSKTKSAQVAPTPE